MAIQLDEVTLIALIVESLFFGEFVQYAVVLFMLRRNRLGIFTVLFSISVYIFILRKRGGSSRVNRPLITVSVIMYIMALAVSSFLGYISEPALTKIAYMRLQSKSHDSISQKGGWSW